MAPNQFMPCAPLAVFSPPLGGGTSSQKKEKNEWRDVCAPGSFRPSTVASIKKNTRPFSTVPSSRRCCSLPKKKKRKRDHTRELQMLRRLFVGKGRAGCYFLAVLYLLFVMYWWLLWVFLVGFLRSCVSLFHLIRSLLVQRIIECTSCWFRKGFSLYKLWLS